MKKIKQFKFKPFKTNGLKFKDVQYHRNGVSGEGFYCAVATDPEQKGDMLITFFPDVDSGGICCAVYKLSLLPSIKFGVNSWRGDHYATSMKNAVAEYRRQWDEFYAL